MGKKFLRSVIVQDQAIGADGVYDFALPVNPLSVVIINLRPLNDTGTLANYPGYLALAAAINRAVITHRGAAIVSGRGEDLAALAFFRHGCQTMLANTDNTDNERRCMSLPIFMGRHAWDDNGCFPASPRGTLNLSLDLDIADTGYDGLRLTVETLELLQAKPKWFERKTTVSQTWAATGDNDMDLPLGNVLRGALLWGTTGFVGAAPAPSWGRVEVLVDNEQHHYAGADFEVLQSEPYLHGRMPPSLMGHAHTFNDAAAGVTATLGLGYLHGESEGWNKYAYLDFDPTLDDDYSINTREAMSVRLRANAETADAVRCIAIERCSVSALEG